MKTQKINWIKYGIGFVACMLFRFLPFRAPNLEPILATQMPFAKKYGKFAGFSFGFFGIIIFDIFTSGIGPWTWVTALAYGLLGLWASRFFQNRNGSSINFAKFAFLSTVAYDIVTGLTVGPIFFNQPFLQALMGQIPFTLLHLAGNVTLAFLLSPLIDYAINKEKISKKSFFINQLTQKYIS